jgi:hypothetical protein
VNLVCQQLRQRATCDVSIGNVSSQFSALEDEFEFESTIFKIWRRQSAGNENKIPVIILITGCLLKS